MSAELAVGLVALALADALNPGTILTCALLLLTPRPLPRTAVFVAATSAAYLAGALLLYTGVDAVLRPLLGSTAVLVGLGVALAAVLVGAGVHLWRTPPRPRRTELAPRWLALPTVAVLGFLASLSDIPTAVPLIVAVERLSGAGVGPVTAVVALTGYVVLYALPLLGMLGLVAAAGNRGTALLQRLRDRLAAPDPARAARRRRRLGGALVAAGAGVLAALPAVAG